MASLLFRKLEGVQRGFLSERKGKVIPCRGAEDRKGTGINSGKSDTRKSGGWEYHKLSGEYGSVCKVEDSHKDQTDQCGWYVYNKECVSYTSNVCTETEWAVICLLLWLNALNICCLQRQTLTDARVLRKYIMTWSTKQYPVKAETVWDRDSP